VEIQSLILGDAQESARQVREAGPVQTTNEIEKREALILSYTESKKGTPPFLLLLR
jgi:hypothetical protein